MKKTLIFSLICLLTLTSCSAIYTSIKKRNLRVENQMSNTIFLPPVAGTGAIYLQVRNTTDQSNLNIRSDISRKLEAKGYQIASDPAQAQYILQVNTLKVGRTDAREREGAVAGGFGGALSGGIAGGIAGGFSHSPHGAGVGALAGAAAGLVGDALVEDVFYTMVTDVQITLKTSGQKYQTRVVSTANKVNLKLEKAVPALTEGLAQSIAGIF